MDIEISNIEVLGNMVLIERSENDTSIGELSLSASSSTPRSSGTILQIGKSCSHFIEVGDLVILDSTKITVITVDDKEYICVDFSSLIGKVKAGEIFPLGKRILVKRQESDTHMGELMLSDSSLTKKSIGTILSIGDKVEELEPGNFVIFDKYGETSISYEDEEYVVISPETVIAKINL